MSFSKRHGYTTIRQLLQEESMDSTLRNSLWNAIYGSKVLLVNGLYEEIICDFFKDTLEIKDSDFLILNESSERANDIKKRFFKLEWYEVYDFIEYYINSKYFNERKSEYKTYLRNLKKDINNYLERELSAYRIVDNIILKITDENEINSIEQAILIKDNKFQSVKTHFAASILRLSDKTKPDYRNSIKESISAVEACCRILTGESTLGKALDKLNKNGIEINTQLRDAFEKLYVYTNNKSSGIRHAIIESGRKPDFDDAKYMLVSCSAFTNYLVSKSKNNASI